MSNNSPTTHSHHNVVKSDWINIGEKHLVVDVVPRLGARSMEWNGSYISIVFSSYFYDNICLHNSRNMIGDVSNFLRDFLVFLGILLFLCSPQAVTHYKTLVQFSSQPHVTHLWTYGQNSTVMRHPSKMKFEWSMEILQHNHYLWKVLPLLPNLTTIIIKWKLIQLPWSIMTDWTFQIGFPWPFWLWRVVFMSMRYTGVTSSIGR